MLSNSYQHIVLYAESLIGVVACPAFLLINLLLVYESLIVKSISTDVVGSLYTKMGCQSIYTPVSGVHLWRHQLHKCSGSLVVLLYGNKKYLIRIRM